MREQAVLAASQAGKLDVDKLMTRELMCLELHGREMEW
jgi:hypothetical protein